MGNALGREAGSGFADQRLTREFGAVEEAKIARSGAIERRNAGDAPIEIGARLRFSPSERKNLAQRQARSPLKKERLGHATFVPARPAAAVRKSCRRRIGRSASCRRRVS